MLLKPNSITDIQRRCGEWILVEELHELDHKRILELGCGRAELTRRIAEAGPGRRIVALETDETQLALNLGIDDLPGVRFGLGSAQQIPLERASFDAAFLFKSLHHVPVEHMDSAFRELARVLEPGALLHVSEPLFMGAFNEILRLFHDEERVREEAYAALLRAVDAGLFRHQSQHFFLAPVHFADFAEFEARIVRVSHLNHQLSDELLAEVRERFEQHLESDGVHFLQPCRIDLLCAQVG